MTHDSPAVTPLPDLILYGKPGCGLCVEAREIVEALLAERERSARPAPRLVERDITTNAEWERAFFLTIPVLDLGGRQLELATRLDPIRALLADMLDGGAA